MNRLGRGGQSLTDRVMAAKHSLTGRGLAKAVHKASTEEPLGPKLKHLEYLVKCTCDETVSIPELATLLQERTRSSSWIVVCKALITTHHLMNYGSERFAQYLASNNCTYNLDMNPAVTGCDMSVYIRQYANYLNEKAISYRLAGSDFSRIKWRNEAVMRKLDQEKLLKELQFLQSQLESLLQIQMTPDDVDSKVISSFFVLLFKDLVALHACHLEGIANLLEHYFEMSKKLCREGVGIYKKFIATVEPVCIMAKLAETAGIEDCPKISSPNMPPFIILEALENHLDGTKKSPLKSSPDIAAEVTKFVNALEADISNISAVICSPNNIARTPESIGSNENNSNLGGSQPSETSSYLEQPLSDDRKGYLILMASHKGPSQNSSSSPSILNSSEPSNLSPVTTNNIINLATPDLMSCTNPFLSMSDFGRTSEISKVNETLGNEFVNPSSDLFGLISTSPVTDLSSLNSNSSATNDVFGLTVNGDGLDLFGVQSSSQSENQFSSTGPSVIVPPGANQSYFKSFDVFNTPASQWTANGASRAFVPISDSRHLEIKLQCFRATLRKCLSRLPSHRTISLKRTMPTSTHDLRPLLTTSTSDHLLKLTKILQTIQKVAPALLWVVPCLLITRRNSRHRMRLSFLGRHPHLARRSR